MPTCLEGAACFLVAPHLLLQAAQVAPTLHQGRAAEGDAGDEQYAGGNTDRYGDPCLALSQSVQSSIGE